MRFTAPPLGDITEPVPHTEGTRMIYTIPPEMAEATRLTNAGKLAEATALIQRLLNGQAVSGAASAGSSTIIDADYVTVDAAPQHAASHAEAKPRAGLRETLRRLAAEARATGFDIGAGIARRPTPDPLPPGATFTTASYANAAGTRDYKLYVPAKAHGDHLALVVMLHGCTQSPDDFAAGTRMNALAEEQGCLVAYPAQPASANAKKCWNWFKPEDQHRDQGEPSLIAGITRQIMRDHRVDPSRVYIAGMSAGGAAAAIMAAAYPDLYAAVGVHSGLPAGAANDLPSAFAAMRQGSEGKGRRAQFVPTIVFHGDQDATVNPSNGNAVVAAATGSTTGLRSTLQRGRAPGGLAYSRRAYADASGRVLCEQWTIHGAGHAWSGGSPAGSYTDPRGPDAAREMLRFFDAYHQAS
jgi:poly(hydroxyalkanoate) depolymerase family esterase